MVMQSGLTEAGTARPWPAERIEYWALERLIPYASNARLHSEGGHCQVEGSSRNTGARTVVMPRWLRCAIAPPPLIGRSEASTGR